jgi:hydroxymethylglutaryl-CoA lyase
MSDKSQVKIIEVGPRDGLQNEKQILDIETKFQFILDLVEAGLNTVELTSFVRADRIPQMADAAELFAKVKSHFGKDFSKINFPCLVPNQKGYENSQKVGVSEIALFTATSEEFNKKNINATIDESLARFDQVMESAKADSIPVRGYISTVFGCPYQGETSVDILLKVSEHLLNKGVYEISLGDTIGVAQPAQVSMILERIKKEFKTENFALHFHDTHGRAVANAYEAYRLGFRSFDASAGGLGGCPYAKGATGNVATEDLVEMFNLMNVETGINLDKLVSASSKVLKMINRESESRVHKLINFK